MKKRGQMQISFGMIFSIILMIIFLAFAIYGISKFLSLQKGIQIESFKKDIKEDVKTIWQSSQGSDIYKYNLPKKTLKVCFSNEEYNLRVVIKGEFIEDKIDYLNVEQNICIPVIDGELKIILKKDFGERLVTIEKP